MPKIEIINHKGGVINLNFAAAIDVRMGDGTSGQRPGSEGVMQEFSRTVMNHAHPLVVQAYKATAAVFQYILQHKLAALLHGVAASYVYVNYKLYRLERFLADSQRWCRWSSELSLAQLMLLGNEDVRGRLLNDARMRYECGSAEKNICSKEGIIQRIMDEIRREREVLEAYRQMIAYVDVLDSVQKRCLAFCDGALGHFCGVPLASLIRGVMARVNVTALFYLHASLMRDVRELEVRLDYLLDLLRA